MSKDNLTFDELKKAAKGSNPKPEPLGNPQVATCDGYCQCNRRGA